MNLRNRCNDVAVQVVRQNGKVILGLASQADPHDTTVSPGQLVVALTPTQAYKLSQALLTEAKLVIRGRSK